MYLIYSLPRSRTFWLSRFLSYGDWHCGHDELLHCRSLADVRSWLSMPNAGSVETIAAPYWRLVRDVPTVVIRRPVPDVVESILRRNPTFNRDAITWHMHRLDAKLNQIERRVPEVISVQFDTMNAASCRRIWERCLPYPFDIEWHRDLEAMNLQTNFAHTMRYYQAHEPQLITLGKIAAHTIRAMIRPSAVDHDDGVTIQQEPFAVAYRDGQQLYADHCILVGEAPDSHEEKNLELMQALEDDGYLMVTTARSNGRIFGYLVATITPSIEARDRLVAVHTMFCCSPLIRGLGMKLQRASIEALKKRGVEELYLHAGIRGSGPRMGTLFRRLGAMRFGECYRLDLTHK